MERWVLTIGREYGSGGRTIAKQVAQELGAPFYDKELIAMTAKEAGFAEEYVREAKEKKPTSFLYGLYYSSQHLPLSDQVFIAESKVIRRLAEQGPCVIVGRCADYVLRDHPSCIRAFIHGPLEQRVRRVQEEYGVGGSAEEARSYVVKRDKARASYYNYFTTGRWGDCHNYHLAVSSGQGADTVIQTLLCFSRGIAGER